MTEKRKNILIIFLVLTSIILTILLVLSVNNSKNSNNIPIKENTQQIEVLNAQLQNYQTIDDNSSIEKENVCTNFLKTYYSVQHSKSKAASLPECKAYLTTQLYDKLSPAEEGTEYSQKDVDIDYTSSISIKDTYLNRSDPERLIVRCAIKRTINDIQSVNEYFVSLKVENVNNEWLVSNFELISIMGG